MRVPCMPSAQGFSDRLLEHLDKLLNVFTTKPLGEGMCVGLSISKRTMDAHKGELFLDREFPHSRFVVRIPNQQSNAG